MVGKLPTSLADQSLFRTKDDDTNVAAGRSYVTKTGLPFALNLPISTFNYVVEGKDISCVYLHFVE